MPELPSPKEFLRRLKPGLPRMIETLRQFVGIRIAPVLKRRPADRCCGLIAEAWRNRTLESSALLRSIAAIICGFRMGPGKRALQASSWF